MNIETSTRQDSKEEFLPPLFPSHATLSGFNNVRCLSVSGDGSRCVLSDDSGEIAIVNPVQARVIKRFSMDEPAADPAAAPRHARIWHMATSYDREQKVAFVAAALSPPESEPASEGNPPEPELAPRRLPTSIRIVAVPLGPPLSLFAPVARLDLPPMPQPTGPAAVAVAPAAAAAPPLPSSGKGSAAAAVPPPAAPQPPATSGLAADNLHAAAIRQAGATHGESLLEGGCGCATLGPTRAGVATGEGIFAMQLSSPRRLDPLGTGVEGLTQASLTPADTRTVLYLLVTLGPRLQLFQVPLPPQVEALLRSGNPLQLSVPTDGSGAALFPASAYSELTVPAHCVLTLTGPPPFGAAATTRPARPLPPSVAIPPPAAEWRPLAGPSAHGCLLAAPRPAPEANPVMAPLPSGQPFSAVPTGRSSAIPMTPSALRRSTPGSAYMGSPSPSPSGAGLEGPDAVPWAPASLLVWWAGELVAARYDLYRCAPGYTDPAPDQRWHLSAPVSCFGTPAGTCHGVGWQRLGGCPPSPPPSVRASAASGLSKVGAGGADEPEDDAAPPEAAVWTCCPANGSAGDGAEAVACAAGLADGTAWAWSHQDAQCLVSASSTLPITAVALSVAPREPIRVACANQGGALLVYQLGSDLPSCSATTQARWGSRAEAHRQSRLGLADPQRRPLVPEAPLVPPVPIELAFIGNGRAVVLRDSGGQTRIFLTRFQAASERDQLVALARLPDVDTFNPLACAARCMALAQPTSEGHTLLIFDLDQMLQSLGTGRPSTAIAIPMPSPDALRASSSGSQFPTGASDQGLSLVQRPVGIPCRLQRLLAERSNGREAREARAGEMKASNTSSLLETIHWKPSDEAVFGLYYSMSKDQSDGYKKMNLANLVLQTLQMIAISFSGIEWPLGASEPYVRTAFSYIDLSVSSSSQLSLYIVFSLVCLFIVSAITDALVVAVLFHKNKSLPLLPLKVLRVLTISMVSFLYMPCVGILLAILDCNYIGYAIPMHAVLPGVECWAMPHIVPSAISLVVLAVFVPFSQFTSLFLFNNDPKKGGLLSRPNGRLDFAVLLCKLAIVGITKLLTRYHTVRSIASICGYLALGLCSVSCLFGAVAPSVSTGQLATTAAFWACYFLAMPGVACLAVFLCRVRARALWALDGQAHQLPAFYLQRRLQPQPSTALLPAANTSAVLGASDVDASAHAAEGPGGTGPAGGATAGSRSPTPNPGQWAGSSDDPKQGPGPILAAKPPKFRSAKAVERAVRFLQLSVCQLKQYRKQKDYVAYADFLYTEAFRKQRNNPSLHLSYAIFLLTSDPQTPAFPRSRSLSFTRRGPVQTYRKNFPRCMAQLQLARQCYPSMDERFVIYVKSKDWEQQTSAGGDLRSAHVMSVFTFKRHFSMAQKYHEAAKAGLRDLCDVLLAPVVEPPRIPQLTATIVDSEAKAREYYELLLGSHPNSLQILRAYGSLLRDIYHDEDSARILFARADLLEDDASISDASSSRNSQSTLQQLHQKKKKDAEKRERRDRKKKKLDEIRLVTHKENLLPHFCLKLTILHGVCLAAIVLSLAVSLHTMSAMHAASAELGGMLEMGALAARLAIDAKVDISSPPTPAGEARAAASPIDATVLPTINATRLALAATATRFRTLQTAVYASSLQTGMHEHYEANGLNATEISVGDGANLVQFSLRGLLDRFAEVALDLATRPLGSWGQPRPVLLEALKEVGFRYGDAIERQRVLVESLIIPLTDVVGAVVLFCILTFFVRTSIRLGRDRDVALAQVLAIPKTVIRGMLDALTAEQLDEAPRVRAGTGTDNEKATLMIPTRADMSSPQPQPQPPPQPDPAPPTGPRASPAPGWAAAAASPSPAPGPLPASLGRTPSDRFLEMTSIAEIGSDTESAAALRSSVASLEALARPPGTHPGPGACSSTAAKDIISALQRAPETGVPVGGVGPSPPILLETPSSGDEGPLATGGLSDSDGEGRPAAPPGALAAPMPDSTAFEPSVARARGTKRRTLITSPSSESVKIRPDVSTGSLQAVIQPAKAPGKMSKVASHRQIAAAKRRILVAKGAKSIPKRVWCRIIWGILVMLVALGFTAIFTVIALHDPDAIGHPMALCGLQQAQAAVVRLLATQLLFNSSLPLLDNPANPAATSPVWRDLSHLSNDRAALQRLLAGQADYLERIGLVLLYGTDSGVTTADRAVDGRAFGRSSGRYAARERLLDGTQGCLMRNASDCVAGRIRGLDETLVGLSPLLARYLGAARKLSALPPERLRPGNPYFEFLFTAGMWDLGDGMQSWTESFQTEYDEMVGSSRSLLITFALINIAVICITFGLPPRLCAPSIPPCPSCSPGGGFGHFPMLLGPAAALLPTKPLLWDVAHKTKKMLELFPEDASDTLCAFEVVGALIPCRAPPELELGSPMGSGCASHLPPAPIFEWSDVHLVGLPTIDGDHKALVDLAGRLAATLNEPSENPALAQSLAERLWQTAVGHIFREERLMEAVGFPQAKSHRAQHEALQTRLRQVLDDIQLGDASAVLALDQLAKDCLLGEPHLADRVLAAFAIEKGRHP
ncbi:hypothetical protein PAPYR_2376 [Paratrimastix pyriformis]|uniref:Uncharacterized protein n=1 Tax=Paratrimastix pyriformis TaxID=342808 RepID=A0ABQ8UX25_9EUKA|nr:hypothetical protein PAPYR_2376 [Paratrimastix pyriformis]